MRYARACRKYEDFLYRDRRLTMKLLEHGFVAARLKSSLQRFYVVIINSWILTVHPSAPWKLICSTCHSFPFLCLLSWTWLFMSNSAGVSRKAEESYPTGASGPCSEFLMEFELLISFVTLFVLFQLPYVLCCFVCFPCLVFVPRLYSFDFR